MHVWFSWSLWKTSVQIGRFYGCVFDHDSIWGNLIALWWQYIMLTVCLSHFQCVRLTLVETLHKWTKRYAVMDKCLYYTLVRSYICSSCSVDSGNNAATWMAENDMRCDGAKWGGLKVWRFTKKDFLFIGIEPLGFVYYRLSLFVTSVVCRLARKVFSRFWSPKYLFCLQKALIFQHVNYLTLLFVVFSCWMTLKQSNRSYLLRFLVTLCKSRK